MQCLTATLHKTQQKNQRGFWRCDQNPFDATIVTIDGLNSFMLVFLNLMTRDLFSALMSLFFSLISAHLQQVDNLTSLVQRSAQYAFQPFGLSAQALQGSPLYCSCLFPLILFIFSPSGLGSLSPLGSCLHTCIVTLGLAASLTSTMASVILLELPTSLPAPQVFSPFPSFPFHLLLPNLLSLSGSF